MPNRLSSSASPYLRQHADNPVDWMPWGEEAFARARAEQKPIFLSVGYATCHWCHVMAHESFESPAIAESLNRNFVSVKVDREERPDVDRVYMTYIQAMTGHGGWPMSVWLTPDLKPFYGGTYFPPDDRHGRAGFARVIEAIAKGWAVDRKEFLGEAERAYRALGAQLSEHAIAAAGPLKAEEGFVDAIRQKAFAGLNERFDPDRGGFGGAPKFPQPGLLLFLLDFAARTADADDARESLRMVEETLAHMSRGGIHDHVGGGFHRYSVDEDWFVPHFEKMLYDQAQLAVVALEARRATGDERYAWLARDILDYVLADLTDAAGGFYSAEDADSGVPGAADGEHREGAFYVWGEEEFDRVLGPAAAFMADHFGVQAGGNVPEARDPQEEFRGMNLLAQARPLGATAERHGLEPERAVQLVAESLELLRGARSARPRPLCDRKVVTAWNGLMLSALAKAATSPSAVVAERWRGGREGREACLGAAIRCAEFLRRELWDEPSGALVRSWCDGVRGAPAVAEDHAFLIQGLLDLHEADFDGRWLEWARVLQERMDARFHDELGGYFNSAADAGDIVLRLKEDYDGAEPAASSVAARNLFRLSVLFGRDDWRERALRTLAAFRSRWEAIPQAMPTMLLALGWAAEPSPARVVLVGEPGSGDFQALAEAARASSGGLRVLAGVTPRTDASLRERLGVPEANDTAGLTTACAYVCRGFVCEAPVETPEALRILLEGA